MLLSVTALKSSRVGARGCADGQQLSPRSRFSVDAVAFGRRNHSRVSNRWRIVAGATRRFGRRIDDRVTWRNHCGKAAMKAETGSKPVRSLVSQLTGYAGTLGERCRAGKNSYAVCRA